MSRTGVRIWRRSAAICLAAIIAVDRDVFFGQVAGQHAVAALAQSKRDFERDFGPLHYRGDFDLVVSEVALALVGDADAAEPDRQLVAVGGLAGFADRHDDAAP